ncbi:MAG TPA: vanadium-dependent haloperoxidase, partial [Roseiflexaceae bacterium]|nr:vanadium-dependent haloperoxidase [Roseiflexaceae bacterium]
WQLPAGQSPMTPWAAKLRPVMLERPNQFRPGAPLDMASRAWAANFNEVKTVGSIDSPYRTAEQTDIARFWTANPIAQYNAAFGQITTERGLNAMQAARLFAMGNLVGTDALIACFDAKYTYLFWRPQFAIPQGEYDGNAGTAGDPNWKPLLGAPTHPEYPSGHGCLTGAEAEVFAAFFGTNQIEIDLVSTAPNVVQTQRHYRHVHDLTREVANARVWGGIHFRDATTAGLNTGRKVAHWTLKRFFLVEK